jgi:predicted TPR repeat methyltransferase
MQNYAEQFHDILLSNVDALDFCVPDFVKDRLRALELNLLDLLCLLRNGSITSFEDHLQGVLFQISGETCDGVSLCMMGWYEHNAHRLEPVFLNSVM